MFTQKTIWCAAFAAALAGSGVAAADPVADFYKGKQINIIVGTGGGGSYGLYARTLGPYWSKYIPGNPSVIVTNMGGAGGRKESNYVYNVAPKDGTKVGMPIYLVPFHQAMGRPNVRYDANKFQWIGSMADLVSVVAVWHTAPLKTIADAKKIAVTLGTTGRGSETFTMPTVVNGILGTKFKTVSGYKGIATIDLAIERGEVQGRAGSWASWKQIHPDWVKAKKVRVLVQVGMRRAPDLPDVPLLVEQADSPEDRAVLELISVSTPISRPFHVAPGVPAERVQALRRAFDKAVRDPALLAEAKKRKIDVTPLSGEEMQKIVAKVVATPKSVIAKIKTIIK